MFKPGRFRNTRLMDPAKEGGEGGDGGGGGGDDAAATEAARLKAEQDAKDKGAPKQPSDREAELLKEVMGKKETIKGLQKQLDEAAARFEGIDPDAVRKLLEDQKAAERTEMEKRGEFDRVKAQMAEEHNKQIAALKKQVEDSVNPLQSENTSLKSQIQELTVGRSFGDSSYIRQLTLTPAKARVVYGSHFEVNESGQIVGYDKPAGSSERTMLVDANGSPLSFESSIQRIVEADSDYEDLIRSNLRPGTGSQGNEDGAPAPQQKVGTGRNRIAASIKKNPDQLKLVVQ